MVACGTLVICRSMCSCFICLWILFVYISSNCVCMGMDVYSIFECISVCMRTEADLRGAGMCSGGRG